MTKLLQFRLPLAEDLNFKSIWRSWGVPPDN